jgi:CheY-specific phosphatase CheX
MANLNEILTQAAEEVLENMFFSGVMGEMAEPPEGERVCATVTFDGSSHGTLSVSAPLSTASALAAGFLGEEEGSVARAQARAVVGELANVLCGVVLGRMNPDGDFVISPPDVTRADSEVSVLELHHWFELMEGDLAIGLTVH